MTKATVSALLKMLKFLVKVFKSLYLLNLWIDLVDTLPDVRINQVIYTLDTICEPNIMTLDQVVLKIFCSQGSIGL